MAIEMEALASMIINNLRRISAHFSSLKRKTIAHKISLILTIKPAKTATTRMKQLFRNT